MLAVVHTMATTTGQRRRALALILLPAGARTLNLQSDALVSGLSILREVRTCKEDS